MHQTHIEMMRAAAMISIKVSRATISHIMSNKVSPLELIDQLVMLVQLLKLQAIRVIFIQHLER